MRVALLMTTPGMMDEGVEDMELGSNGRGRYITEMRRVRERTALYAQDVNRSGVIIFLFHPS